MEDGGALLQRDLQTWRVCKAQDTSVKSYDIFSNSAMLEIIKRRPKTTTELMIIPGMSAKVVSKHGREIIQIVARYWWSGDVGTGDTYSKNPAAGMVWTEEQDEQLMSMHRAGMKPEEIAVFMRKATGIITSRLKRHREASANAAASQHAAGSPTKSPVRKKTRASPGSASARVTRSMPFSMNPGADGTAAPEGGDSTPRGRRAATASAASPRPGSAGRVPLRSSSTNRSAGAAHSPRAPSSSPASVRKVKEELKAHLRQAQAATARAGAAGGAAKENSAEEAERREEREQERRAAEAAARLRQWRAEQQARRDKWRESYNSQQQQQHQSARGSAGHERAQPSPRARASAAGGSRPSTSRYSTGSQSARGAGGGFSYEHARPRAGAGGAGAGTGAQSARGGSGRYQRSSSFQDDPRAQAAEREKKTKDDERTKRHAAVALWGKWLTKPAPDLATLAVKELKEFLSLSGMPDGDMKKLFEKSDLQEAAKGRINAWEVERVRACKGVSTEHYCVLRVSPRRAGDPSSLKKAFRQLSLLVHPDKNKTEGASEAFHQVKEAFEVLSDDSRRKSYEAMVQARTGKAAA